MVKQKTKCISGGYLPPKMECVTVKLCAPALVLTSPGGSIEEVGDEVEYQFDL